MTIDKRDQITLPKWLVIIVIPIIVGGFSGLASSMYSLGGAVKQIEINTKRLDIVEGEIVTQAEITKIDNSLGRIENKLDLHLLQPTIPRAVK
jgi:Sec-independent protein translocase protein TatA